MQLNLLIHQQTFKRIDAVSNFQHFWIRDLTNHFTCVFFTNNNNRPVVVVRKEDTGEVIRQIPNPEVLKVAHSIDALKGLLMNKQI